MSPQELVETLRALGHQEQTQWTAMATVWSGHPGGAVNPRLVFDGETVATTKGYPRLVNVAANQRVLLLRAGSTWVVLGPIL